MQDNLDLGLGASDVGHLANRDTESSSENTAKVRGWVGELVSLAVALVKSDKDAHVVLAREDLYRRASKLGRDLIETASGDALFGAANVEGADGRVMGCLFGEIRDTNELVVGFCAMLRHRKRNGGRVLIALDRSFQA